jgi:hypothetical protein
MFVDGVRSEKLESGESLVGDIDRALSVMDQVVSKMISISQG